MDADHSQSTTTDSSRGSAGQQAAAERQLAVHLAAALHCDEVWPPVLEVMCGVSPHAFAAAAIACTSDREPPISLGRRRLQEDTARWIESLVVDPSVRHAIADEAVCFIDVDEFSVQPPAAEEAPIPQQVVVVRVDCRAMPFAAICILCDTPDGGDADAVDTWRAIGELTAATLDRIYRGPVRHPSLEDLRSLFNQVDDMLFVFDRSGQLLETNEEACRRLGYSRHELLDLSVEQLHPPEARQAARRIMGEILAGKRRTCELPLISRDGELIEVESHVSFGPWCGDWVVFGVSRDVSERRAAEKALQKAHEALEERVAQQTSEWQALLRAFPDLLFRYRTDGTIVNFYAGDESGLYAPPEDFVDRNVRDILPKDSADRLLNAVRRSVRERRMISVEYRLPIGDSSRDYEARVQPLTEDEAFVVVRDITERKARIEALRLSEARFRAIFNSASFGVVLTDIYGQVLEVNAALVRILGYQPSELVGQSYSVVTHPEDLPTSHRYYQRLAMGGQTTELEKRYVHKDGHEVWVRLIGAVIRDGQGEPRYVVSLIEDITERRQAEQEKRRQESERAHYARLIAMGELAAGIAHQLNQPLTAVVNYTQGCVRRMKANSPEERALRDAMVEAASQAQRAGSIVQHLRRLMQKTGPNRAAIDLNQVIGQAVALIVDAESRRQNVAVHFVPAPDLPRVHADPVQIEQVVLNLLHNAVEAVSESSPALREITVRTCSAGPGEVEAIVTDTAACPVPDDIEQFFQPFYSTKGEGMGMGLKISRTIVEAHGGQLWGQVDSQDGMSFRFRLPVHTDQSAGI
jgi:PAS domain S-box-containing protein